MPGTTHRPPGVGRVPVLLPVRCHVQPGLTPVHAEGVGVEAEVAVSVEVSVQVGIHQVVTGAEVSVVILPALHLRDSQGQGQASW